MEGEHGFNTREEWQNYFQIYFDQIRELEEINSFQMNKEPQQWLADFSTKAQKLEKNIRNKIYICSSMFIILQEKVIRGPEILQIPCFPFCTGTVHVLRILPPLMNWLAVYMHFMKHKTILWH